MTINSVHIVLILFVVAMGSILIRISATTGKTLTLNLSSGRNLAGYGVGEKSIQLKRGQFPTHVTFKGRGDCGVKIGGNFDSPVEIHFCSTFTHIFAHHRITNHMAPLIVFTPLYGDFKATLEII